MDFRARAAINWKYKAKSKAGLQASNRFEVSAKTDASQQTILAGLVLV